MMAPHLCRGANTGATAQFKSLNGKMLYMDCYGHALNIVVKDSCINVKCLKETFEAVREISLLVKKSPKRNKNLDELHNHSKNDGKSIYTFCPTLFTVLFTETLESVL